MPASIRLSLVLIALCMTGLIAGVPTVRGQGATSRPFSHLAQVEVFKAGQDGYHTYRIPSVIQTPRGRLLAFAEGRRANASDAGDIDLLVRSSDDGGRTWSALVVIGDNGPNTFGNPCPVVDRTTGVIWLLTTQNRGDDHERDIIAGTSRGTRTVWVMQSADDGRTWSAPREITTSAKRDAWTWYATGPGIGIQLRSGRLVIPANHALASTGEHRAHLLYSDDHGATWAVGGISVAGTNESQVVELADGRVLLNSRNHPPRARNLRMVSTSDDGGLTLSAPVEDQALIEPPAQASVIRMSALSGGVGRLLFSNPASTRRERMAVRASVDEGRSWPVLRVLHEGPAAYSCLVVLDDRTIGVLYERGWRSPYERVTFARFSLDWLEPGR